MSHIEKVSIAYQGSVYTVPITVQQNIDQLLDPWAQNRAAVVTDDKLKEELDEIKGYVGRLQHHGATLDYEIFLRCKREADLRNLAEVLALELSEARGEAVPIEWPAHVEEIDGPLPPVNTEGEEPVAGRKGGVPADIQQLMAQSDTPDKPPETEPTTEGAGIGGVDASSDGPSPAPVGNQEISCSECGKPFNADDSVYNVRDGRKLCITCYENLPKASSVDSCQAAGGELPEPTKDLSQGQPTGGMDAPGENGLPAQS